MSLDILSLIVFVICIILFIWDKLPMATTAILGCVVMVVAGVCDFKTAFGQFSSSTVILTIGVMVIGGSISETGLASAIGNWIVKISKGSETKLIIGTYIVSAIMSAFLTNSAVLAVFIPIIMSLSSSNANIKAKNLIMPIAIACVLGGTTTLVGSTQQMTAQGLLEEAGLRLFKTFDFVPVAGIISLLGLIYCLTIGHKLGVVIWDDRKDESDYETASISAKRSKPKMITMAVIFVSTVVFYITEWIPIAVTSTSAALLCIITGCITQKKAISSVNWNIVGRLAGSLGLAKALEAAGGTELLAEGFSKLVGTSLNPFFLFCILILFIQVSGQFISNSTSILIIMPILIAIAPSMGLNTYAYALGMTIASGCTLSCPLASSTLGMSMVVGYKFNDYFKYNVWLDIMAFIAIITLIPIMYGLTI